MAMARKGELEGQMDLPWDQAQGAEAAPDDEAAAAASPYTHHLALKLLGAKIEAEADAGLTARAREHVKRPAASWLERRR